jgi:hypothetical protein
MLRRQFKSAQTARAIEANGARRARAWLVFLSRAVPALTDPICGGMLTSGSS